MPTGTEPTTTTQGDEPAPRVTFVAGGYVLVLMALFAIALITWALWPVFTRERPPGDGVNPSSYLFDLDHSAIPVDDIVPAMLHREMVPTMDRAVVIDGASLAPSEVADQREKLLVSSDRVIGVTINGASRAYPINVLNVHEIINDTLGGEPIAVTYHWPSDGALVFDRRLRDRTVTFAVSGLLYNANMLFYPRNEPSTGATGESTDGAGGVRVGGESLYCQLLARAVTGTDAAQGQTLRIVPSQLTSWGRWIASHPETSVAGRDPTLSEKRYERGDPGEYRISEEVKFAPERMPPGDSWAPKTRVVAVQVDEQRRVYPLPLIREHAGPDGTFTGSLANATLQFAYDHPSQTVEVTLEDGSVPLLYHAYWFAWHAMHPEDELAQR